MDKIEDRGMPYLCQGGLLLVTITIFYLCFSLMKAVGLTVTFLCSEHTPRISFHCCHSVTANLGQCNLLELVHSLIHRLFYHFHWNGMRVERKKLIRLSRPTLPFPKSIYQDELQGVTFCIKSPR